MVGNQGFCRHGGSDSLCYFKHVNNCEWAIVFEEDNLGDYSRGKDIFDEMSLKLCEEE